MMASDKQHIRDCLFFALQLKKIPPKGKEIIYKTLREDDVSYSTCKKRFQKFRNGNFNLEDDERAGKLRKFEDGDLEQLLAENPCQTQSNLILYHLPNR